ncbi:MAG: hypothetical protein C4521_02405 [Actinobacteria bacterium]|nr:MAG: hypothetical protein C4521_02405 [Actinomycetota bacterium]
MNRGGRIGETLYELAKRPEVEKVLEIGTWNGEGSTYCLAQGLGETSGRLVSIEVDAEQHGKAASFYEGKDLPVELIQGLTLHPDDYAPYESYLPLISEHHYEQEAPGTHETWYRQELELAGSAERTDVLWELLEREGEFDLVLFDGGEFLSHSEFLFLEPHVARYIVLDDTNGRMAIKNTLSRDWLIGSSAWELAIDEQHERNGWLVAERKRVSS